MNLTPYQIDALKELINIGLGRAAGVLNEMLNAHIHLQVPQVKVFTPLELKKELEELSGARLAAVQLGFKGSFSGTSALVFPTDTASKLVDALTGDEPGISDLDSVRIGTLTEIGNIVLNGIIGSISNVLQLRMNYSIPTYMEDFVDNLLTLDNPEHSVTILLARTHFIIEQFQIEGDIILVFEVGAFGTLLDAIDTDPELSFEQDHND